MDSEKSVWPWLTLLDVRPDAQLAFDEHEEIQCHAISTLRNLAASSENNKRQSTSSCTVS
jgi:hypothetical protein